MAESIQTIDSKSLLSVQGLFIYTDEKQVPQGQLYLKSLRNFSSLPTVSGWHPCSEIGIPPRFLVKVGKISGVDLKLVVSDIFFLKKKNKYNFYTHKIIISLIVFLSLKATHV